MPVSYDKLWKLLIDRKMNRTDLKEKACISYNIIAKMGKNEFVSMSILDKMCKTLGTDYGEIMEYVPDKEESTGDK